MTVGKGFGIVIVAGIGSAAVGGLAGYLLGRFLPEYYWAVFPNYHEPRLTGWKVGLGLGISQGFVGGLIIGAAIVACVTWYEVTKLRHQRKGPSQD